MTTSHAQSPYWWLILKVASFQLCWFSLVVLEDLAVPWVLAWLIGHWSLSPTPNADKRLMIQFLLIGIVMETIHMYSGLLVLPHQEGPLPPLWLLCLWPLFATLLLHSLRWLLTRRLIGVLFTALGGWASYKVGASLANGELLWPYSLLIALEWGGIFWLCCHFLIPAALSCPAKQSLP